MYRTPSREYVNIRVFRTSQTFLFLIRGRPAHPWPAAALPWPAAPRPSPPEPGAAEPPKSPRIPPANLVERSRPPPAVARRARSPPAAGRACSSNRAHLEPSPAGAGLASMSAYCQLNVRFILIYRCKMVMSWWFGVAALISRGGVPWVPSPLLLLLLGSCRGGARLGSWLPPWSGAGLLRPPCSARLATRCPPAARCPPAGLFWVAPAWRVARPGRVRGSPPSGAAPACCRLGPPSAARCGGPSVGACWRSVWGCAAAPPPRSPRWLASRRFARGCAVVASLTAFSPRSAAFVAFSCGSLSSVLVRPGRSGAAWVLVAGFESLSSASAFARRAAIRSGRSVALRPGAGGAAGEWSVSCPVSWSSSRGPAGAGRLLPVAGGVRGLSETLDRAGLPNV